MQLYADEIEALDSHAEELAAEPNGEIPSICGGMNEQTVSRYCQELISSVFGDSTIVTSDNLFTLGMDSLQALLIVRKMKQGLRILDITPSTLYSNPSISALTGAVLRLWNQQQSSQSSKEEERSYIRSAIIEEYRGMIDEITVPSRAPRQTPGKVVILTDSTGALGSYILNTLLASSVYHVFCLNRAKDSKSVQLKRNLGRSLPTQFDLSRVTFLTADLAQPSFDLSPDWYNEILNSTTHVIHNAWPVNFNLPLSSFRPQLQGLVNLMKFTTTVPNIPHLFFISSISSVMSYCTHL